MLKVIKYVIIDILRNKFIVAYTLLLFLLSFSIFNLGDNAAKGLLGMLNIVLIIVPLVSLLFTTIYMYNSSEFIELLISQPVRRTQLLLSLFTGISLSLIIAFAIGAGVPLVFLVQTPAAVWLAVTGLLLSLVFVSLAMLGAVITRDKAKGIGIAMLLWLTFTLLYDGVVLLLVFQLSDYPLEKPVIILSSLNPVDLARILILLKLDTAALMGYTGALFSKFFGTSVGIIFSASVLFLWIILPLLFAVRKFRRKDM